LSTLACKITKTSTDMDRIKWLQCAGLYQAHRNIYVDCHQQEREMNTWADALSKPKLRQGLFDEWERTKQRIIRVAIPQNWTPEYLLPVTFTTQCDVLPLRTPSHKQSLTR
jgi:hypothetical protein